MAAGSWNDCEETPHIQGQRSPSTMVEGMKSPLNQNPYPPEMLRGLKQNLCAPNPRDPTETETELCLSVFCRGMGQQWTAAGAGTLDAVDLGMAQALLKEVTINLTIEPPELTQNWRNRLQTNIQAEFRKGRGTRDQIANIRWIIEKARDFQKNIYFCFIDYAKAFDSVDHNKMWKILQEMGIAGHLTCLLRNLYAGQEATFRTGHGSGRERSISRLYIVTLLI